MLLTTTIALALAMQTATPPATGAAGDPGAAIRTAAIAWSTCLKGKVPGVPASITPEAGADSVMAACKAEQIAVEQAAEAQIALAPSEAQAGARQQLAEGLAQAHTGLIDGIRQMRAAQPAPGATPTPAPGK